MGLEIDGKSLIERSVGSMYDLCSRIVVVGGYRIERVRELLKPYQKVEVIFNRQYAQGMFRSVRVGAAQVRGDRFFLTPGDYPLITPEICQRLLKVEGEIVIPTFRGRKGHPILMAGHIAQDLLQESATSNLRNFIEQCGCQTIELDDEGVLLDLDTPEDYQAILERVQRGGCDDGVNQYPRSESR
jgi:molybdenum cofactor cytidylyltransferase